MDSTAFWSHWQALLDPFRLAFTTPGQPIHRVCRSLIF